MCFNLASVANSRKVYRIVKSDDLKCYGLKRLPIQSSFEARCLFVVALLHKVKQGRLLCAVFPVSKNRAPIHHVSNP